MYLIEHEETSDGSNALMHNLNGCAQIDWPWANKTSLAGETSDGSYELMHDLNWCAQKNWPWA